MKHSNKKKSAALKAIAAGRPLTQVGRELKVSPITLAKWRDATKSGVVVTARNKTPKARVAHKSVQVSDDDTSFRAYLISLGAKALRERLQSI